MLEMDGPARLWLYKTCHKQFWRVAGWYEFDDLVQDGFMKFYHVQRKYSRARRDSKHGAVTEQRHLMALFKIAFINHIHGLATRRTRAPDDCLLEDMAVAKAIGADQLADSLLPAEQSNAELFTSICQAPEPVQRLLGKIASEPELPALRSAYRVRRDGTRETLNQRLCRIAKVEPELAQNGLWFWLEPGVNLVGMIKACLT